MPAGTTSEPVVGSIDKPARPALLTSVVVSSAAPTGVPPSVAPASRATLPPPAGTLAVIASASSTPLVALVVLLPGLASLLAPVAALIVTLPLAGLT